jgi:hypothetical protein
MFKRLGLLAGPGLLLLALGCVSHHYPTAVPPAPSPVAEPAPAPASEAAPLPPEAPPPPSFTAESSPEPSALSPGAREVMRLKDAGYSDEFLLNKIRQDNQSFHLSTDDLVALRQGGISETVIDAMVHSGGESFPFQLKQSVAKHAEFRGIVRRTHGFLGIGGSKHRATGKLVIDEDKVDWHQDDDASENFSMFERNIKEMWLNCAPRAGENLCLEICFKTYSGDEWCFRDAGWVNGDSRQITAIFDYFQKAFPATFFSQREKKTF